MVSPAPDQQRLTMNDIQAATTAAAVRRIVSKYRGDADSKRAVKQFGDKMLQHLRGK